ncbi:methionyl-tRNA synthetase [Jatrophihabitans endophyticus]|uniref:Methionine--tRNA ligase n=1 Tax=Jatrophihabitans endophyticus TaxID=1206085 RepID=A0A1M5U271_9ACTN|nr:methionine--tRNA ligase [Jatrophihabitans endophyticus]SHH57185.1 methionyl-tRNA synthetase [Jatrophihabitans endophyticus]
MTDQHILTAAAWPYANGPRHIGHVAGIGVPPDVFSRYQRMAGNKVLMVSGTDEHGTPIQVQADQEGVSARELADRNALVIAKDIQALGVSFDLFTRTTTQNHYAIAQEIFLGLRKNGYIFPQTQLGAVSPSTGRTLPDRYIEGTCPICGYPQARGDQCDNCGNQLDPVDLIDPVSRINGETPRFVEIEQMMLDLPAFGEVLATWLRKQDHWRPNVQRFSLNLLDDLKPRSYTRDLEWGIPVPLDGWRDRPDKSIYVWFDAVVGYLSASIQWAQLRGEPEAWRAWWQSDDARAYYFMGKDNIVFHAEIWPAMLMGYSGVGAKGGTPGSLGALNRPYEVVSSEFLTMEGRKFSSSRNVVIYVGDMLSRYDADALRYYLAVAGPETQDTDFTWSEFVRRNNDELVAGWGNLVNRTISMTAKNLGAVPDPGALTDADHALLATSRAAFGTVGDLLARSRQKAAIGEAMGVVGAANKYLSDMEPWKLKNSDPERMASVLHVALQVVDDAKTLLTPFLPSSSSRVHAMLRGEGRWAAMPDLVELDEPTAVGSPTYSVLTGDYDTGARWESVPIEVGRQLAPPTPVFTKLDPAIVAEELERLAPGD